MVSNFTTVFKFTIGWIRRSAVASMALDVGSLDSDGQPKTYSGAQDAIDAAGRHQLDFLHSYGATPVVTCVTRP